MDAFDYLLRLPHGRRQKKLASSRPPIDKEHFVSRIVTGGGDARAAEMVWDTLVADWALEGLTPYPDDSLEYVFGLAEEDRDEDLILRMLIELGIPVPDQDFVYRFGGRLSVAHCAVCRRVPSAADSVKRAAASRRFLAG